MSTNTLTDARVKGLKPGPKPQKHFDGGGLHCFVSPTGAKTWRVAYRLNGKPKTMSLGPYPEVSLATARIKRDELRAVLRDGGDPMAPRQAREQDGMPFDEACETYWAGRKDLTDGYRANATRGIEMHLSPALGKRPIRSITRADLIECLSVMDAKGTHNYVRKVRMWVSQVFDWAVERGKCDINPAALIDPKKAFVRPPKVAHFPALDLSEMPAFMARLKLEDDLSSVLACKLLAYTWVRTNEARFATPGEFDLADGMWRLAESRMKMSKGHLVPLSRQAVAVVRELERRRGMSPYLLPSYNRPDRTISENTVLALIGRMGYKGRMTGHGFRTIASTWANERGYNPDAIEVQLAHTPNDDTRAAYNRARYLPERRQMMQDFADWLDSLA